MANINSKQLPFFFSILSLFRISVFEHIELPISKDLQTKQIESITTRWLQNTTYNERVSRLKSNFIPHCVCIVVVEISGIERIECDTKLVIYECGIPLETLRFVILCKRSTLRYDLHILKSNRIEFKLIAINRCVSITLLDKLGKKGDRKNICGITNKAK